MLQTSNHTIANTKVWKKSGRARCEQAQNEKTITIFLPI